MALKGITKRWFFNSLSLIILILIVIEVSLAFFIQNFFYGGVMRTLYSKASSLSTVFANYEESSEGAFNVRAREYVEGFEDKNLMELIAYDSRDQVIITSTGFLPSEGEYIEDYDKAKMNSSHEAMYTGRLLSGENIMALTKAIYSAEGEYMGAVRYIVSLKNVDSVIFWSIVSCILVGLAVLAFVIMSSSYFIKSIVNPIRDIGKTARKIALGDFNARIEKRYDDEVGELCDTVNYMAKKLGESEKMKNDFISSVSHELRTPLTAIKGWAETMQLCEEKDTEMRSRGLTIIVHEAERLCGIVEELLDFSRMQSGRMVLTLDRIDILAELGEAVYMFKDRAADEKKFLEYEEPQMISPVLGDKNRLRQVFINIIDNALKYTAVGGFVKINVSEDSEYVKIVVSDTGCGIPQKHLPNVKEKFYKANTTQKGSGIGLAVANDIVLLHSGKLEIESRENVGTTVTISIPVIRQNSESKV